MKVYRVAATDQLDDVVLHIYNKQKNRAQSDVEGGKGGIFFGREILISGEAGPGGRGDKLWALYHPARVTVKPSKKSPFPPEALTFSPPPSLPHFVP